MPTAPLHSVCRWCFPGQSLEELCATARALGIASVELLSVDELSTLTRYDLQCALVSHTTATLDDGTKVGGIERAWNRVEHHDALMAVTVPHLEALAAAGARQVVCFSGNRAGLDDDTGMANCVAGLRRLAPVAEDLGVTLALELLNSKVDHPDYMCDRTAWGVAVCEQVDSPALRLLYDIYHMQIMEGDVIATIRRHHRWISHYHTAGVPGRHELHGAQELNYPAIAAAIRATDYTGFIGHEFLASDGVDPLDALRHAVALCS